MTANKLLATPAHNSFIDTWDQPLNANFVNIDEALGNYTTLNATGLSGTIAITNSQAVPLGFIVTGTPSGNINYQLPAGVGGIWLIRNAATLGASITLGFSSASGGATVNIPAGYNLPISADGTANGMAAIDTVPTSVAGGSNTQIQINVAGVLGGYAGFTFDGTTFHTPEITVDGNAVFGTGAGSTITINGTAISAPNGFNFNSGAFQMNAGGMIGIGTAPTAAALTVGGQVKITSGGVNWPNGLVQTTSQILQLVTTAVTSTAALAGTYATATGSAPTSSGGTPITAMATTFTPKSAGSTLELEVTLKGTAYVTDDFLLAIFNGSTLVDFVTFLGTSTAAVSESIYLKTYLASPGTTAQSLTVRIGSNSGNTWGMNQTNSGGGPVTQSGWTSWFSIQEKLAG